MAGGSSLAARDAQISHYLSQSEHGSRIEFWWGQRLYTSLPLCPTLWHEGARAIRQQNVAVRLVLLAMVGTDHLDRLAGQRVVGISDVHLVALAVRSRGSLLGVLQSD
jgi:hypothetical protein